MGRTTDNNACENLIDLVQRDRKIGKPSTSARKDSEEARKSRRKKNFSTKHFLYGAKS